MKGTYKNRIDLYKPNHSTYGGEITPFDFDGHQNMVNMAAKIARDKAFDRQCQRDALNRDMRKAMSLIQNKEK